MDGYFPDSRTVTVDGDEYLVRPLPGRQNAFQAMPNRPTMGQVMTGIDPIIYARSVRAIEISTGCKVLRESIQNRSNNTIAAVSCT